MSKPTLGLAVIMQNEEVHIPASIAQFYHVASDIVVVDGGSSDKSVEWAERMGARVFHHTFENDFSAQKNYAIQQLSTDWVYLHDPDERLEPTLLEIIPKLITEIGQRTFMREGVDFLPDADEVFDCIGIPRRNFIDGVQTPIYPDYQYRLFKNYCRFEGVVHEKIVGYKNRTELDYKRPYAASPKGRKSGGGRIITTTRGQFETGVEIHDFEQTARFNILHYKSSVRQLGQDILYRKLRGD
jgi:glycosyltransferase involved in cell wall biosynthesis